MSSVTLIITASRSHKQFNSTNFGCTYTKDKWITNLLGCYIGNAYEDDANTIGVMSHFVADVNLDYAMSKNTSLAFSVDNIFNREYTQIITLGGNITNIYAPGRVDYLELTQKF